ncbi:hypothetical protein L596_010727 [Steinernema carpocapsae]|uniref:Kelch repeat protein n=2 Tax=Steinernema carpocapsae TaxID=34508 RepID=A0A4U5PJB7_STECR|nr:hypothetical protein L596_010727 [Steinernema carpocapsae]
MLRSLPPIVVLGGCRLMREREAYESVEILDKNGARIVNQMKEKRRGPAVMAISRNELLVVGGCSQEGVHLRSIEKLNLDTKKSEILGEIGHNFSCAAFCPLQDGRLFIAGGYDGISSISNVCVVSQDGKFENFEPLPSELKNSAAVEVDGKVYLFGGWDGRRTLQSIVIYNIEGQKWDVCAGLKEPIECHSATKIGRGIYIIGGFDSVMVVPSIYRFDLDSRTCEELSSARLTQARENHTTVAVETDDDKTLLVVIAGWNGREALDSVELFEVLPEEPWLQKVSENVVTSVPRNKAVALTLPPGNR